VGAIDILSESSLDEEQHEYLDIIQSSTNALIDLMTDALEKGPIHREFQPDLMTVEVDLGALIVEVCKLCSAEAFSKGVELVCEIASDVPRLVWVESTKLHQVMMALIEDAILHADSGVVYCGVRAPTSGLLRAALEIEVSHSLSGGVDPAFGDEFAESLPSIFATPAAEDESIREIVASLSGTIDTSAAEGGVSFVRLQFDWAVGTERMMKQSKGPLDGRRVGVVMEPLRTQEVSVVC
jgi:hypothetical protein